AGRPHRGTNMAKVMSLFFAAAIAFGSVAAAEATPAQIPAVPAASSLSITVAACAPGTHLGRYGKYCWPDHLGVVSPCPGGYHLGPHGEYCWPNHVFSVPAQWSEACPPGYHLGREGIRCWPGP